MQKIRISCTAHKKEASGGYVISKIPLLCFLYMLGYAMHQYARNSLSELFEVKALQEVLLPHGVVGKAKRKLMVRFHIPFLRLYMVGFGLTYVHMNFRVVRDKGSPHVCQLHQ